MKNRTTSRWQVKHSILIIPARFRIKCQVLLKKSIRCEVQIKLDVPWAFDKELFTVAQTNDLNKFPELKNPMEREEIKQFCCGLCTGGDNIIIKFFCTGKSCERTSDIHFSYRVKGQKLLHSYLWIFWCQLFFKIISQSTWIKCFLWKWRISNN